jgi:soluble lytic murein transglycosylase-like protein
MYLLDASKYLLQALTFSLLLTAPLSAICQVFVSSNVESGAITLSNFQSNEAPELLLPAMEENTVANAVHTSADKLDASSISAKAEKFRALIDSVASTVNVAPRLIHAVILAESNYEPRAVSSRGAVGLMQLMPATAKRFGIQNPFVEKDNVTAGASYLKWLSAYFRGDTELVLAAYNAGEQAVVKAGLKVPQYPETQAYVRRIMAHLRSTSEAPL